MRTFSMALVLTAVPLVIAPVLLLSSIDPSEAALAFEAPYYFAFLLIIFLMIACSTIATIIGGALMARGRSARGVFFGLGVGVMLGMASCTASFKTWFWAD